MPFLIKIKKIVVDVLTHIIAILVCRFILKI